MMMRSPFMLNPDWYDASLPEWLAPNCVAEAARDFGFTDDRVRLALSAAALREGKKVSDWEVAAEIGAGAGKIDKKQLLERARSPEIEKRVRAARRNFMRCRSRSARRLSSTRKLAIARSSPAL